MFETVLQAPDYRHDDDGNNDEFNGDTQEHREPSIHLPQDKADDGHQKNCRDEQPGTEAAIDLEPPAKPSVGRY